MKLWLLEVRWDQPEGNAWGIVDDDDDGSIDDGVVTQLVVCAETETRARVLATDLGELETTRNPQAWLSDKYSTCGELIAGGQERVIARNIVGA